MNTKRLYVLVRKDLPFAYQGVQAGHAVAEWMVDNHQEWWNYSQSCARGAIEPEQWENETLIYLSVADEKELLEWAANLPAAIVFREPDINNEATALAILSDGQEFKKLKLWGK